MNNNNENEQQDNNQDRLIDQRELDVINKLYLGGFVLLPLIWIFLIINYYNLFKVKLKKTKQNLNEIELKFIKIIQRAMIFSAIEIILLIVWIIIFQTNYESLKFLSIIAINDDNW